MTRRSAYLEETFPTKVPATRGRGLAICASLILRYWGRQDAAVYFHPTWLDRQAPRRRRSQLMPMELLDILRDLLRRYECRCRQELDEVRGLSPLERLFITFALQKFARTSRTPGLPIAAEKHSSRGNDPSLVSASGSCGYLSSIPQVLWK